MILLPGPAGDFVGAIAIAVVLMLVWSLVIALTVTPALAGWFLKANTSSGLSIPPLGRAFRASIFWSVRDPIKSVALSLILPVMGFGAFPTLTAQFFPGVERNRFYLEIDMPPRTAIAQTADLARSVDELLQGENGIDGAYWSLGKSGPAF